MHEQMERLYEAAEKLRDVTGQSAVARLLNVSPQRVSNWEARGVSADSMIDAQQIIGCSAVWVRDGTGPMVIGDPVPVVPRESLLAESLKMTCETAAELQLVTVHRLSNQDNRKAIEIAVDLARRALSLGIVLNDR